MFAHGTYIHVIHTWRRVCRYLAVAQSFSFGNVDAKLTGSGPSAIWAKSGFLGVIFMNELLLESWIQIVLQSQCAWCHASRSSGVSRPARLHFVVVYAPAFNTCMRTCLLVA